MKKYKDAKTQDLKKALNKAWNEYVQLRDEMDQREIEKENVKLKSLVGKYFRDEETNIYYCNLSIDEDGLNSFYFNVKNFDNEEGVIFGYTTLLLDFVEHKTMKKISSIEWNNMLNKVLNGLAGKLEFINKV